MLIYMLLVNSVLIFGWMIFLWILNILLKNREIADIGWSLGILLIAFFSFSLGDTPFERKLLLLSLISLWSIRLFSHLFFRFLRRDEEKLYYQQLRNQGSQSFELKILLNYLAQGFFSLLITLPFLSLAIDPRPSLSLLEGIGAFIVFSAILGESLADRQLSLFKKTEKKVCTVGLWGYSRHPNYFFEWLVWIGFALMALPSPYGAMGLISVGLMFFKLLFGSGFANTEEQLVKSYKKDYLDYQREVSGFIPLFKKSFKSF